MIGLLHAHPLRRSGRGTSARPAVGAPESSPGPIVRGPTALRDSHVAGPSIRTPSGTLQFTRVDHHRVPSLARCLAPWWSTAGAGYWHVAHLTRSETATYLHQVVDCADREPWLGLLDGRPVAYLETYDPSRALPTGCHLGLEGDLGLRVLMAPPNGCRHRGLTRDVSSATMRWCVDVLRAQWVVTDPDVADLRTAAMNARAGFRVAREVTLPGRRAALSYCWAHWFRDSPLAQRSWMEHTGLD